MHVGRYLCPMPGEWLLGSVGYRLALAADPLPSSRSASDMPSEAGSVGQLHELVGARSPPMDNGVFRYAGQHGERVLPPLHAARFGAYPAGHLG